ncbi:GNAT family N-acetyltransferase [Dyella subtropica]|uniref:GNAT family N-acetyltransferase n=1 Tax=Dyella subtropica TaxID=2992127 RepID=UPI00224F9A6C|nr:N-acetyltransferase [Dyella subtropica]
MPLLIRRPRPDPDDLNEILVVHRAAFGREDEARLVEQLHASRRNTFELLAEQNGEVVAHVLFSPIRIEHGDDAQALGLAPMAVTPALQRRGIGTALIREALLALTVSSFRAVVVLGDPAYYGRFGFTPASSFDLQDTYGGGDAFMALALCENGLQGYRGQVDYAPEFANLTD